VKRTTFVMTSTAPPASTATPLERPRAVAPLAVDGATDFGRLVGVLVFLAVAKG